MPFWPLKTDGGRWFGQSRGKVVGGALAGWLALRWLSAWFEGAVDTKSVTYVPSTSGILAVPRVLLNTLHGYRLTSPGDVL
jgi:hypothetical protein